MTDQKKIDRLRKKIDRIDSDMIALLKERMQLTGEIGKIKDRLNKAVKDEERESALFDRIIKLAEQKGMDISFVTHIWQLILQESYRVQNDPR
jgi:chorismate mutase/prephenate dehydratase